MNIIAFLELPPGIFINVTQVYKKSANLKRRNCCCKL